MSNTAAELPEDPIVASERKACAQKLEQLAQGVVGCSRMLGIRPDIRDALECCAQRLRAVAESIHPWTPPTAEETRAALGRFGLPVN